LAAKRLTKTGCRLTISAATPAGIPRLTAKKQPPKKVPWSVNPIIVEGKTIDRVIGWLLRKKEIAMKRSRAAIVIRIAKK
jgi:hypothetical protein